jgi:hypothetical protein
MPFGLRYFDGGKENRLLQISGSRLRIRQGEHTWWIKLAAKPWEVYETDDGRLWPNREQAEEVSRNLRRAS